MPTVEQSAIINAPLHVVMESLNDVESIPTWATVTGTISNVQGKGPGMTYQWQYSIDTFSFGGKSEVLEQTDTTLITKTNGDIESIWTINLTPINKDITAIRVVVEYMPPNIFLDVLADLVLEHLNSPAVATENMNRFKALVEARTKTAAKEQIIANS